MDKLLCLDDDMELWCKGDTSFIGHPDLNLYSPDGDKEHDLATRIMKTCLMYGINEDYDIGYAPAQLSTESRYVKEFHGVKFGNTVKTPHFKPLTEYEVELKLSIEREEQREG